MPTEMTFTDGIIELLVQLSPVFLLVCTLFIILSWLRILVDLMSGRGF